MTKNKENKEVIDGPEIEIKGKLGRFKIVEKVVRHFIRFEKDKKGKGKEFRYPVEKLSIGGNLYIHRPGVKWNFDFKVVIPPNYGLKKGRHDQIALLLRKIRKSSRDDFEKIWNIISHLYHCKNNDVDSMLKNTRISPIGKVVPDVLLKVIKWLFIMEDIIYWHYDGRAFLYNFFKYVIFENNKKTLKEIIAKIRQRKIKPEKIKKLLQNMQVEWENP